MISKLRTPDKRFENLPNFNFVPNYIDDLSDYEDLRVHYLDEGKRDSNEVFLCLHGEPTWCYLYRKMIPVFTAGGIRSIAPDFLGFGRSDKPSDETVYTFDFHRNFLLKFIDRLNLKNITLVCQDWGGVLGLTIPMEMPDRFKRLIIMNTGFGTGRVNEAFLKWKEFNNSEPDLQVHRLMKKWEPTISEEEAMAYSAPFPSKEYKAGVRTFPNLVPISKEDPAAKLSRNAASWWKKNWTGESFMAIGMKDPILGPDVMNAMRNTIRDCPDPLEIHEAGHFVQEFGDLIAKRALKQFRIA